MIMDNYKLVQDMTVYPGDEIQKQGIKVGLISVSIINPSDAVS